MIPELFVFAASLMFVCAFVLATGGAISAIRAALLWSAGRLGACLGWSIGSLNALFWVAWLMILVAPHWVFEASFQMSVVATALILSRPDEDASSLKISWRLTWGLAPLTLVHFGEASFAGVLFNLVAIPLFTHWILPFGLLALLAGILGETAEIVALLDLAETILRVAGWGGNLLLELASWAQVFPDGKPRSWLCWMLGLQSIRTWLWASPKAIAPISTRFLRGLDGLLPFWGALFLLGVSALRVLWE